MTSQLNENTSRPGSGKLPPLLPSKPLTPGSAPPRNQLSLDGNQISRPSSSGVRLWEEFNCLSRSSGTSTSSENNSDRGPSQEGDLAYGAKKKTDTGSKIVNLLPGKIPDEGQHDWKIAFMEQEISTKTRQLDKLKKMKPISAPSPNASEASPVCDSYGARTGHEETVTRLREENVKLGQNFVALTEVVKKSQKQINRKDSIISKLQENANLKIGVKGYQKLPESENRLKELIKLILFPESVGSNINLNDKFKDSFRETLVRVKEGVAEGNDLCPAGSGTELPEKLVAVIRDVIYEWWPNWMMIKDTISSLKESVEESKESGKSKTEKELLFRRQSYYKLEDKYKTALEEVRVVDKKLLMFYNSVGETMRVFLDLDVDQINFTPDFISTSIMKLSEERSALEIELEAVKKWRQEEEDQIYRLVQAISEAEMELELLGRRNSTLKDVVSNFIKATCANRGSSYSSSLTKLILQTYSSQQKWLESSSTLLDARLNYALWQTNEEEEDEDIVLPDDSLSKAKAQAACFARIEPLLDEDVEGPDVSLDEDQMSDEQSEEEPEVDVNKINYILMSRPYNGSQMKRDLEVVDEVEEDLTEESEESTLSEDTEEEVKEMVEEMVTFVAYSLEAPRDAASQLDSHELPLDDVPVYESKIEAVEAQEEKDDEVVVEEEEVDGEGEEKNEINGEVHRVEVIEEPCVKLVIERDESCVQQRPESESSQRKSSLENIPDSALGSEGNCSTPEIRGSSFRFNDEEKEQGFQKQLELREIIREVKEEKEKHLQTALEMALRVDELKKRQDKDGEQLRIARERIGALEDQLEGKGQRDQHLADELEAWKELVDHQKAILGKVKDELEETQRRLKRKEEEVEEIRRQAQQRVASLQKLVEYKDSESQTDSIISDEYIGAKGVDEENNLIEEPSNETQGYSRLYLNSAEHSESYDGYHLRHLFRRDSLDSASVKSETVSEGLSQLSQVGSSLSGRVAFLSEEELAEPAGGGLGLDSGQSSRALESDECYSAPDHFSPPLPSSYSDGFRRPFYPVTHPSEGQLEGRHSCQGRFCESQLQFRRFINRIPLTLKKVEIVFIPEEMKMSSRKRREEKEKQEDSENKSTLPTLVKDNKSNPKPPFLC